MSEAPWVNPDVMLQGARPLSALEVVSLPPGSWVISEKRNRRFELLELTPWRIETENRNLQRAIEGEFRLATVRLSVLLKTGSLNYVDSAVDVDRWVSDNTDATREDIREYAEAKVGSKASGWHLAHRGLAVELPWWHHAALLMADADHLEPKVGSGRTLWHRTSDGKWRPITPGIATQASWRASDSMMATLNPAPASISEGIAP